MLPLHALIAANLSEEDIYAGHADNIRILSDNMVAVVERHLSAVPKENIPRSVLPAFLPAALIPSYLKLMKRSGFDPYRDPVEISVPRKQVAMLSAMLRARI